MIRESGLRDLYQRNVELIPVPQPQPNFGGLVLRLERGSDYKIGSANGNDQRRRIRACRIPVLQPRTEHPATFLVNHAGSDTVAIALVVGDISKRRIEITQSGRLPALDEVIELYRRRQPGTGIETDAMNQPYRQIGILTAAGITDCAGTGVTANIVV